MQQTENVRCSKKAYEKCRIRRYTRTQLVAATSAMTCKQLQQLSNTEQIQIILELQARVVEFEKQIRGYSGLPKNCTNFSVPPSNGPKPNFADRERKRGPKTRPSGPHSQAPAAGRDRRECRPHRCCARCGADLTDVFAKLIGTSQVVELPLTKPLIEARRYQVTCAHQQADYLPDLGPQRTFLARIEALVCARAPDCWAQSLLSASVFAVSCAVNVAAAS